MKKRTPLSPMATLVKALLLLPVAAMGQTWNGGGADDLWGTGANWVGGNSPVTGSGVTVNFDGATRLTPNFNYGDYSEIGSIFFNAGAGSFTLNGAPIKINSKIENTSTNLQTINFGVLVFKGGSFSEINPVNGDITVSSPIFLDTPQLRIWGDNGKTVTFNGVIANGTSNGSVSINQNSNVVYNAAQTYSGGTFINAGKLIFGAGGSANSGALNLLDTTGTANAAIELAPLTGGLGLTSALIVRSGSSGNASLNALNTSGTNTLSGGITLNKGLAISTTTGGTLAISNVISGSSGLTLSGGGTVAITANNSFTGGTTVSGGTLTLNTGNSNRGTGTGTLTINSTGTVTAVSGTGGSGHNQFGNYNTGTTVPIVINGGTLNPSEYNHLNSLTMMGGTINVGGSAGGDGLDFNTSASVAPTITTLASPDTATIASKITLKANVAMNVADGAAASDLTISGNIVGGLGLNKTGAGTLTLSGTNSYTGITTVSGGVLAFGTIANGAANSGIGAAGNGAGNLILDGGTLRYTGATATTDRGLTVNNVAGNKIDVSTAGTTLTMTNVFAGTGTLTKTGDGTLAISANNNGLTGGVVVEAGFLNISGANNGNTSVGNSLTVKTGAVARAFSHNVFGQGAGTALSTLIIDGGTFEADAYNHINSITMTGGTLGIRSGVTQVDGMDMKVRASVNPTITTNAAATAATISSRLSINAPLTITVADGAATTDLSITGTMAGGSAVTKEGAGTLSLDATNTFTGGLTVNGGRVIANGGGGKLANSSNVIINNTGTFQIDGTNSLPTAATAVNFTVNNGGTLLVNSGSHIHFGNLTLNGGTLSGTNGKGVYNSEDIQLNGSVTVGGSSASTISLPNGLALVGSPTFTVANSTGDANPDLILTGPAAGGIIQDNDAGPGDSLIKAGPGTLQILSSATHSGTTTVTDGKLLISSFIRNTSSITVTGANSVLETGAVNMFANDHNTALPASKVITIDGGTWIMNSNMDSRFGNVTLSNGATWTSNRGVTVHDALLANTSSGAATVTVSGTGAAIMNGTGGIHLQGVQNFAVANTTGSPAADLTVSLELAGPGATGGAAGGINKTGDGTMVLATPSSYTGNTIVAEGTLVVNSSLASGSVTVNNGATLSGVSTFGGNVVINGLLSPGNSPGTMTFNNTNLSFGSSGSALFEIGGTTTGTFDSLVGINTLTLDGVWNVQLFGGFSPALNDSFDLFSANTVDATGFNVGSDLVLPSLTGDLAWDSSTFASTGVITVIPEPSTSLLGALALALGLRRRRR